MIAAPEGRQQGRLHEILGPTNQRRHAASATRGSPGIRRARRRCCGARAAWTRQCGNARRQGLGHRRQSEPLGPWRLRALQLHDQPRAYRGRLLVSVRHWREDRALRRGDRRRRQQHVDASQRQRSLARQQRRAEHDRRRLHRRCPADRVDPAQLVQVQPGRLDRSSGRRAPERDLAAHEPELGQLDQDRRRKRQRGSRCRPRDPAARRLGDQLREGEQHRQPLDRRRR